MVLLTEEPCCIQAYYEWDTEQHAGLAPSILVSLAFLSGRRDMGPLAPRSDLFEW